MTVTFLQSRARVAPDRNSETHSASQNVPSEDAGASFIWNAPEGAWLGTHEITLGSDFRAIKGTTRETLYPTAASLPEQPHHRSGCGRSTAARRSVLEDAYRYSEALGAVLALRYDHWSNTDGWRDETAYDGTLVQTKFADRSGDEISPKMGVHWRLREASPLERRHTDRFGRRRSTNSIGRFRSARCGPTRTLTLFPRH